MSNVIFELQNVTKRFGDFVALENVTCSIRAGERVALVGPSGAGKSTLISLLNGSQRPDSGLLTVLGQNLTKLNSQQLRHVQRQIGTVHQRFHLVDNLAVIHNVNAGRLGHWSLRQAAFSLIWPREQEAAHKALERVGIPEKLYERTSQLSGGQQQRVAIARVLVQNPAAILADEPIASLDPERAREIMDLLSRLVQEMEKTLVVSVHTLAFAHTHCDRIIGLRHGRILFDSPATEVTAEQLQALYKIEQNETAV